MYINGVVQAVADFEKTAGFFSPTVRALAARIGTGAALGGGAGYLAGEDIPSTLIGAGLGGAALGAGPWAAERIGLRMLKPKTILEKQPGIARYGVRRALERLRNRISNFGAEPGLFDMDNPEFAKEFSKLLRQHKNPLPLITAFERASRELAPLFKRYGYDIPEDVAKQLERKFTPQERKAMEFLR